MAQSHSVLVVYGTRPEAIKLAPVIEALRKNPKVALTIVSTGQHKEMVQQVESRFHITPDYKLKLMHENQPLNRIMSRTLKRLDAVIEKVQPSAIVVQGDTTTAMASALVGFNRQVKVVHVEAGLRSGDLSSPFPEEGNRKIISQIASLHLAPTAIAKENLLHEGVDEESIVITGNSVIDALQAAQHWDIEFTDPAVTEALAAIKEKQQKLILVTTHRRENVAAMPAISRALSLLAILHPDCHFILPVHLNPLVSKVIHSELEGLANVTLVPPMSYGEFTKLLSLSYLLVTDSGGLQEEAPSLGKPVLVMRTNTERPEGVLAGTVKLIGTQEYEIVREVTRLIEDEAEHSRMAEATNPYGDGQAAARSVAAILQLLGIGERMEDFNPTD